MVNPSLFSRIERARFERNNPPCNSFFLFGEVGACGRATPLGVGGCEAPPPT